MYNRHVFIIILWLVGKRKYNNIKILAYFQDVSMWICGFKLDLDWCIKNDNHNVIT